MLEGVEGGGGGERRNSADTALSSVMAPKAPLPLGAFMCSQSVFHYRTWWATSAHTYRVGDNHLSVHLLPYLSHSFLVCLYVCAPRAGNWDWFGSGLTKDCTDVKFLSWHCKQAAFYSNPSIGIMGANRHILTHATLISAEENMTLKHIFEMV